MTTTKSSIILLNITKGYKKKMGGVILVGLAKRRRDVGLSQAKLAELCGVSQAAVAAWECGIKHPTADKLPIIAEALKCSIDDLFRAA